MAQGFLLRFQEPVQAEVSDESDVEMPVTLAGTQTTTKVAHESADADPKSQSMRAIPRRPIPPDTGRPPIPLCGTKTLTEVKKEAPDSDPKSRSFYCIPRA